MNALSKLVQSPGFKNAMIKMYGFGASVVVLGALFKLEHWQGADYMLSAGLITEAVIFFLYAFDSSGNDDKPLLHLPPKLNWQDGSNEFGSSSPWLGGGGSSSLALAKLDAMLENAEITPDLLIKFGEGMKKLGETTENLNAVGDVFSASKSYINTIQAADNSLEKLSKSYEDTISKVTCNTVFKYKGIATSLEIIDEATRTYQHQMETLNGLLANLNAIYKQQKNEEDFYLQDLMSAAKEAKRYRKQISELNENLEALNKYYGDMVTALKPK